MDDVTDAIVRRIWTDESTQQIKAALNAHLKGTEEPLREMVQRAFNASQLAHDLSYSIREGLAISLRAADLVDGPMGT